MRATVASVPVYLEQSEPGLIARLVAGDAAALGTLYDAHAPALLAFARRLLGDAAAAEDLVQDVFLQAPPALERFEGHASLRTFLTAIAVNHARHYVRAAARRRAFSAKLDLEPTAAPGGPDEHLERDSLARALMLSLDTLPLEQRVAFVLCEVEERSAREAADIVGAPEATVRTRVFHAKRKLRTLLAERWRR